MDLLSKEPNTNLNNIKVPIMTFKVIKLVNILLLMNVFLEMKYFFMKMDLLNKSVCGKKENLNPQLIMMKMENNYKCPLHKRRETNKKLDIIKMELVYLNWKIENGSLYLFIEILKLL